MNTTLIVPTLNEVQGIKVIMPRVKPEWCSQVLFLDGGSIDGSISLAKKMGYEVFKHHGITLWEGYRELFLADVIRGDIIITFSPDGNSVPEAIPLLIEKIKEGYDMVIASRYLGGLQSDDDTRITRFGNWTTNLVINAISKVKYTDSLVMYRAYRKKIIKQLGLTNEPNWFQGIANRICTLNGIEPTISMRAGRIPLRITEIPVLEPLAERGRRQNTFIHSLVILMQIINEVFRKV